jgi:hypothetical protein
MAHGMAWEKRPLNIQALAQQTFNRCDASASISLKVNIFEPGMSPTGRLHKHKLSLSPDVPAKN